MGQNIWESPFPIKPLNPVNYILVANSIWLCGVLFFDWSIEQVIVVFSIEVILFTVINFFRMLIAEDNLPFFDLDTLALKLWALPLYFLCCGGLAGLLFEAGRFRVRYNHSESVSLYGYAESLFLNSSNITNFFYSKYGLVLSLILLNNLTNLFITFFYNGRYKVVNPFLITYKTFITLVGMALFMGLIMLPLVSLFSDEQYWKVIAGGIIVLKSGVEIVSYQVFYRRWPNFEVLEARKHRRSS